MLSHKPIGLYCAVLWKDDGYADHENIYISFGTPVTYYNGSNNGYVRHDSYDVYDQDIFYYASEEEIEVIKKAIDSSQSSISIDPEWVIDLTEPWELSYDSYDFLANRY